MCWFDELFPNFSSGDPQITSPDTPNYNGIAYSISHDENDRYWWPDAFCIYYWPNNIPREETLQAFTTMYFSLGYEISDSAEFEPGIERVAIYVDDSGKPTHAARQVEDGYWESKIIDAEDIRHSNLECLQGEIFGSIGIVLQRQRNQAQ